jgi:hypothetical protein
MMFNLTPPVIDMNLFERQDWSFLLYGCDGLNEELPSNMPKSLGLLMMLRVYVDSNYAGDLVT